MPLIAILRGVTPAEAPSIGAALVAAGIILIEVPLNSPDPLTSISNLAGVLQGQAMIGAGTVMRVSEVDSVAARGARFIVSPNLDIDVIRQSHALDLASLPGAATPTEIFLALRASVFAVKLFPGEMIPPTAVRAVRAVAPARARLVVVGGVNADNLGAYRLGGADGAGLGGALYTAGMDADDVGHRAKQLVRAWGAIS